MKAVKLACGFQSYEWGKEASTSLVAAMLDKSVRAQEAVKAGSKFAELWMGTHPSLPSVVEEEPETTLSGFLAAHPTYFSPQHAASEFAGQVPFLLKVLSIGKALSIQAHPNKALAEQLHALDPKNYKDPNHKPELIVAVTDFMGLCCFRSIAGITRFAMEIPSLDALIGNALSSADTIGEKAALKEVMNILYNLTDKDTIRTSLEAHAEKLAAKPANPGDRPPEDAVFLQLMKDFPGDVGCWMVYILNLVELSPGEGLFLRDSEPHAYLSGDGVEVMATSDNVVRAGLTPKFVDVNTLLDMLTYNTQGLAEAIREADAPTKDGIQIQRYVPAPHVLDFSLYRIVVSSDATAPGTVLQKTMQLPTCGIGLVLDGAVTVNGLRMTKGDAFLVPPTVEISADAVASVFVASTNDFPSTS